MSSSDAITVHRLRVRAPRTTAAQGIGDRLAEALRIASKPPALANRFVLIRRLRLSVPPGASAQTMALLVEREWQRVLGAAVLMDEAGASAEVVWAPSEGQARVALLSRWLAGGDDSAWFWQRLVPASAPARLAPIERIAALLLEPLAESVVGTVEVSPSWWREAVPLLSRHRQLEAVLELLPPRPRARLLRLAEAIGARQEAPPSAPQPGAVAPPGLPRSPGQAPEPIIGETLSIRPEPREPAVVEPASRPISGCAAPDEGQAIENHRAAAVPAIEPAAAATAPAARQAPAQWQAEAPPAVAPATTQPANPPPNLSTPPLHGQSTDWAGLWLLVPVLLRQGFAAEALAPGDPQAQHQAAVFKALLQGLRQRYRLDAAACDWMDTLRGQGTEAAQIEAQAWLRKLRLACVRQARLPLLRLLRRPGELLISAHRLDVVMPLRTLDIRLRRAGFDIDSGYLPWLDLVLRFHYV